MSEQTKQDALGHLARFINDPVTISVAGTRYTIAKLRPIDLARAREYMVAQRIRTFMDTTGNMPLEPSVRASALAEIQCTTISILDVMNDADGRLFLLHASLAIAGFQTTVEKLKNALDPIEADEIYAYVLWISGVLKTPQLEADDADPLAASPGKAPSTGTDARPSGSN